MSLDTLLFGIFLMGVCIGAVIGIIYTAVVVDVISYH